jgi:hypothetical protein
MSVESPAPAETTSSSQMLLPGSAPIHEVPEGGQEAAKAPPVRKPAARQEVMWVDPNLLDDHPSNVELFGEQRLHALDDLIISLDTGFDPNRPIKAVRRPDGSAVMIDGHRRRRAALELGQERVPVLFSSFPDESEERLEMLTANLVRNRKYRSVGLGTAVRLVQLLRPREVKRGRPRKEIKARGARISPETRREYYARLLGISVKKFRMAEYVLKHGTKEEKDDLDRGSRSTSAVYAAVHARKEGADLTPTVSPGELARMARDAARAAARLLVAAHEGTAVKAGELEAAVDSLLNYARLETGGEVDPGTTASEGVKLLLTVLGKAEAAPGTLPPEPAA